MTHDAWENGDDIGPSGWDDHGWHADDWGEANGAGARDAEVDQGGGWDDWDQPHGSRRKRRGATRDAAPGWNDAGDNAADDLWAPAGVGAMGARANGGNGANAAWKGATSLAMQAIKQPRSLVGRLRARLSRDRRARITAIVMLVVIVLCTVGTIPVGAFGMSRLKDGLAQVKLAEADFKALSTSPTNLTLIDDAQSHLQKAHDDFAALGPLAGPLGAAGIVPGGAKVAGASKLLPLAVEGTQAGVVACDALKIIVAGVAKNPFGATGGLTSAAMTQVISDFDQIQALFQQMEPQIAALTPADLGMAPQYISTFTSLQAKLPQISQLVNDLDGFAHALPAVLGVGKPSTFLVLILDSSELRPTGGFIGNFGALSINAGKVDISHFHISDITLIDSSVKFGSAPNQQIIPIPDKYAWLKTVFQYPGTASWSLRDSNLTPDYPTTARDALSLYNQLLPDAQKNIQAQGGGITLYDPSKSGEYAGVITFSLGLFQQALGITGAISVPQFHETVTAANFVDKIHYYSLNPTAMTGADNKVCGATSCAKIFTAAVVKAFMDKVKNNLSQYLGKLGKLFYDSLKTKDAEVYLTAPQGERLLQDLNVASVVESPKTGDTVFEVDANIGANKDNHVLQYQMSDQVTLDTSGAATHKLSWGYKWPNNPGPVYPAGSANYHSWSRVFVPPNASLISHSGLLEFNTEQPSTSPSADSFGLKVFHGAAYAPYLDTNWSNYAVSWKAPGVVTHDGSGYHYTLLFQREAGAVWPLTLTVTLPTCATVQGAPLTSGVTGADKVTVSGKTVTVTGPLQDNEKITINYSC